MDLMDIRRSLLMAIMGGGESVVIKKGSFTLAERTTAQNISITHGLGVVPQIFIIEAPNYDTEVETKSTDVVCGLYCSAGLSTPPNGASMDVGYYGTTTATELSFAFLGATNAGRTNFINSLTAQTCCGISYNNNYRYAAGVTYNWMAIAGI